MSHQCGLTAEELNHAALDLCFDTNIQLSRVTTLPSVLAICFNYSRTSKGSSICWTISTTQQMEPKACQRGTFDLQPTSFLMYSRDSSINR